MQSWNIWRDDGAATMMLQILKPRVLTTTAQQGADPACAQRVVGARQAGQCSPGTARSTSRPFGCKGYLASRTPVAPGATRGIFLS